MIIYIVLVDWGTMDGYRDTVHIDSVWSDMEAGGARVQEVRNRKPFPALWANMEVWTVDKKEQQ